MEIRRWRTLKRHPLSNEYEDIKGKAFASIVDDVKEFGVVDRKIVIHEKMVIDGWQLYRACLDADVVPPFVVLRLPKGMTAEKWVEIKNDKRRHETQERAMERIAKRQEKSLKSRVEEGKSIRTIAEESGVSEAQARRDVKEAAEAKGVDAKPKDGKVTGKDGKKQAATKVKPAAVVCERCKRVGGGVSIAGCKTCEALRDAAKKKPASAPKTAAKVEDKKPRRSDQGKSTFNDKHVDELIGKLVKSFDARAGVFGKTKEHQACVDAMDAVAVKFRQWQVATNK